MRKIEDLVYSAKSLFLLKNWYSSCVGYSIAYSEFPEQFSTVVQELFNIKQINLILKGIRNEVERAKWIMNIGNKWNDDEILLIMSIRIDVEMLKEYFEFSNIDFPNFDLKSIDEDLESLKDSKLNKKDYYRALSLMDKNGPKIAKKILPR